MDAERTAYWPAWHAMVGSTVGTGEGLVGSAVGLETGAAVGAGTGTWVGSGTGMDVGLDVGSAGQIESSKAEQVGLELEHVASRVAPQHVLGEAEGQAVHVPER